jgi:transposase
MRFVALDVHSGFCEVAIKDESGLRAAGRVKSSIEELELFAGSLCPDDEVAMEATGPALQIARILKPHVGRVVIANTRRLRAIAEAKVKTDKVDASTLCELLAAGFLPAVWAPDEFTRGLRRRLQRRSKLVRSRTRAKNECHAVLARNLKGRPPVTDVFGKKGRQWLTALELPADESETLECCLREVDFLDSEIGLIERELARQAMSSEEIRRLMTVPGVSLVSAAAFVAAAGDIHRFSSPKKLVSYVGLDPRVRQSGEGPARHGRASWTDLKAGLIRSATHALRGRLGRDQDPRPVARVLCARACSPGSAGGPRGDCQKAQRALLALAHPRRGLRLRAPLAHPPQAARARAQGEGRTAQLAFRPCAFDQARSCARGRVRRAGGDRLPQARRGLAAQARKERCGRDTGARVFKSSS